MFCWGDGELMKKRMPMKMIIPGYIISRFTGLLILFFASAAYADTYNYIWRLDDDGQSLVRQRTLYNGVKVNGDGSLSGLYANVNRLSTGYGEFIDDTDVEGTILDWCFSSSDNGYVITDKYTYLYDGSSLSVVEDHPTHGRIMKAELNSDRNYSFLYEDNTLSNTIWFFWQILIRHQLVMKVLTILPFLGLTMAVPRNIWGISLLMTTHIC